jgi:hypothetical protein
MSTQDHVDVARVVQLYIDGASGDVGKLEEAFHADARMFGHVGDVHTYVPIGEFFKIVANSAGHLAGPNYSSSIRSIEVVGDAAVAILEEKDYMGCDFVDFFSLARIDGRWQIVNKTYAHTGGSLPEG